MFHSENKSLMREGVRHLLQLQVLQQPGFASAFSQVQGPRTVPQYDGHVHFNLSALLLLLYSSSQAP